ncbi:DUF1937 family protein [uncultured Sphingomonas sp.]|uniref:DUF1937 family protein n=1 Tax=uncultured Sphingomonas sp. TaxID=158754 RepID=UPI0030DA7708
MIYLSVPYSSPDSNIRADRVARVRREMARMMAQGHLTVCPVAMNHEAIEQLADAGDPGGSYWRQLEAGLAAVCDELVVVAVEGWRESRGVQREIALFKDQAKPVRLLQADAEPPALERRRVESASASPAVVSERVR